MESSHQDFFESYSMTHKKRIIIFLLPTVWVGVLIILFCTKFYLSTEVVRLYIMAQLNIIFKNSNKFHFEGEKIRVKLEVQVDNSCTVTNIVANFVGLSSYLCIDGKQNNMSKFFTKDSTEIYFDDILPLFVAHDKESSRWEPGVQEFAVEYHLPNTLPTSLESSFGFVRYGVHILADINGEVVKKTEYFTVVSKTDLANDSNAHLPGIQWRPETQCILQSLFCRNATIRAFFFLDKKGYVPGEYLFLKAEITNYHRLPVQWVKATLLQILRFSGAKSVKENRIVAELTRGCILPSETQVWRSESMLIPAVPPSTYPPKRLIRVKYILLFQCKPSWQKIPIELRQKIKIGAVHLVKSGKGEEQGQGEGKALYNSELFNGSNLESCIFGPHTIEEEGKVSTFSPLYPIHI